MAKGCDHEIVRALETHPNVVPWKIKTALYVVTGLQVWSNDICTQTQLKAIS